MRKRRTRSAEIWRIAAAAMLLSLGGAWSGSPALASESTSWPRPTWYTVVARPHDTVARLAQRYDVSAEGVAKLNGLAVGSALGAGRVLRIPAGHSVTREAVLSEALDRGLRNYAAPPITFRASGDVRQHERLAPAVAKNVPEPRPLRFQWPIRGTVISAFGPAGDGERNDGIPRLIDNTKKWLPRARLWIRLLAHDSRWLPVCGGSRRPDRVGARRVCGTSAGAASERAGSSRRRVEL